MPSSERTAALYIVLFLLGASFEFIGMFSSLQNVATQIANQETAFLWVWASDVNAAISWFIAPILFCCAASFTFKDRKRIVSPIYLQIVAFVCSEFLVIFAIVASRFTNPLVPYAFSWSAFTQFLVDWAGTFLVVLGVAGGQLIVVRWFVGLEMPEPLDRVTYSIPQPFRRVRDLIDDTFLQSQELSIVRDDETLGILILVRWSISNAFVGSGRYVVLAFGGNPEATDSGTLLGTVAFERDFYEMRPSRYARAIRDTIVHELERMLNDRRPFADVGIDNAISGLAYTTALEPSLSKVGRTKLAFRDVPASFKTMIVITIFFMLAVFAFYATSFEGFTFSAFIETLALALFALMVEMGIALREEVTARMRRRLGFR